MERPETESKLDQQIKQRLSSSWRKSTRKEIEKAAQIYRQTLPLSPNANKSNQSPSIENMALLTQLKKERRLANNSDYDCTVLNDREQLDVFLKFAKLRYAATGQPFHSVYSAVQRGQFHLTCSQWAIKF